jgi:large subunit ribosomal protein L35
MQPSDIYGMCTLLVSCDAGIGCVVLVFRQRMWMVDLGKSNFKDLKMPKMKTKSAAKKRFSLTAKGKVRANVAYKRHCLSSKPQKMKRTSRGTMILRDCDARIVKKYLPYG